MRHQSAWGLKLRKLDCRRGRVGVRGEPSFRECEVSLGMDVERFLDQERGGILGALGSCDAADDDGHHRDVERGVVERIGRVGEGRQERGIDVCDTSRIECRLEGEIGVDTRDERVELRCVSGTGRGVWHGRV